MRAPMRWWMALALAALLTPGCVDETPGDDDAGDDDATGDDDTVDPGPCDESNTWGSFTIETDDNDGRVRGHYYDGPSPFQLFPIQTVGPCSFYGYDHIPDCDPPCVDPEYCGLDDECHPIPDSLPAGTLTVTGIEPPLVVEPSDWGDYSSGAAIPGLYDAGTELTLSLEGSEFIDPFEMTVAGVVGPMTPDHLSVLITLEEALTVEWTPSAVPADARVQVSFGIDHHALVGGYALCEVADADGQLTVPVEIVDALHSTGSHVENGDLVRFTRAVTETNLGCAEWISYTRGFIHVDY